MMKKSKLIYITGAAIIGISLMLITFLVLLASGVVNLRPKLVFMSGSAEKEYDGTSLTCDDWQLLSGSLKSGHTANITVFASRTDAGVSENTFTVSITEASGGDVTGSYNIEFRYGELKVNALRLDIASGGASKEYDGTRLVYGEYKVLSGSVIDGHTLGVQTTGERTDAGISDNTFTASVTDSDGISVTHNYDIEKTCGALEVKKRAVSISTPSYHSVYDATTVTYKAWKIVSETNILSRHEINVVVSGEQTDAGVSKNSIAEVRITDGGVNVTDNYALTLIEGDLIVTPRSIAVRSASDKKTYDGTPLTNGGWSYVSQTRPVTGQSATVIISGSRTEVGESPNTVAEIILTSGGRDVTFNYEIKVQEGSLIVTGVDPSPGGSGSGQINLDDSGNISRPSEPGGPGGGGNVVAARVYSDFTDKIYLRYMSFGDYGGTKWETAADYPNLIDSEYSLNYLTGTALKNAGYISSPVALEVFGDNYLLPYYPDTDARSHTVQTSDVKYSGSTASVYSAYCYLFNYADSEPGIPVPSRYSAAESLYDNYVRQNYLYVPPGTFGYFQRIIADNGFHMSNAGIISAVAKYIQGAAVYNDSYDTGLDSESDIAKAFLENYKEGICRHFASAATLLYRALGFPARYVIGYAAETKSGEWVEIDALNAHAWVEVYISGTGWVQVEVTGGGQGGQEQGGTEIPDGTLRIKPVDLAALYTSGAVLTAQNRLQGLNDLLLQGYSYTAVVSGKQTAIGIGYSTVTAFTLYDPSGADVTERFNIVFDKGRLHLYVRQLTVTTETLSKIYDGTPLASDPDSCGVSGELIVGHSFETLRATGSLTNAGQSENSCEVRIIGPSGTDVTYMYKIDKSCGSLTVLAKNITITAYSAQKIFNGEPLTSSDYILTADGGGEALGEGDSITVITDGSQTAVGKSQNTVASVTIVNQKGKEVTNNYSIRYVDGWLIVLRA